MKITAASAILALTLISATPAMADKVKFDFWNGNSGDIADKIQDVCRKFNDSQNTYEVVCTSQGSYPAAVQNTIAAFRANKQPAIVQVFDIGTLDLLLSGAYVPIGKLMADNGYHIDWNDYWPGISSYFATSKGELASLPFNNSTVVLYWNKDAFAKIGRTTAPATWEEAAEDMKALKAAGYSCGLGFNVDADSVWQDMEEFSAVNGLPIATKDNGYKGLDAAVTFNRTDFVSFIKDLKGWYDQGYAQIRSKERGKDVVPSFATGECQMIMRSIGDHGTIDATANPGMHWDAAMIPTYGKHARHSTFVGGASLWVLKGKSQAEYAGAAAFLNFLAQPEQAISWSTVTGYIPVTKSGFDALGKAGFYDKAPTKGRDIAIKSLAIASVDDAPGGTRLGGMPQIRAEVANALQAVFTQNAEVQVALDDAAKRSDAILRQFEATHKGQQLP